ncbi:hypothetical protein BH10ACT10_BH10ACT10_19950 [soil metagenome]
MQELDESRLREIAGAAGDRLELWASFLTAFDVASMAEVGVYRGDFAARMLGEAPAIERYYMIDPWRHLDDWNKPANQPDDIFEQFHDETMAKTEAQAHKRVVLRGRTTEVVDQIPDADLELVYIDGDHTLRGITIDLARLFPKVKEGGFVAGDDFCRNIFQHKAGFEPTLVFPYAVYFAEAVGARIYALPHKQFVMQKVPTGEHAFVDLAGRYDRTTLDEQIAARDRKIAKQRRAAARDHGDVGATPGAKAGAQAAVRSVLRRLRSR